MKNSLFDLEDRVIVVTGAAGVLAGGTARYLLEQGAKVVMLDLKQEVVDQIVADAKQAGEAVRADITKQAQEEAAVMIEKARVAIEVETKAALADLQGSIADLSVDVASRMVANDLSDDEHRAIIERYVSEAGSFHAN